MSFGSCRGAAMLLLAFTFACATPVALHPRPLRISETLAVGDSQRRASQRFVLQGLDEDASFAPQRGLGRYELALQVDPTNPFAYLALARHYAERGEGVRALGFLDRSERLLAVEGASGPRVDVHFVGLRGMALLANGQSVQAQAALREAARRSPEIWGDGRLSAHELR